MTPQPGKSADDEAEVCVTNCPYCEDTGALSCSECGGTGVRATTYINGARVTGNSVPTPETIEAFKSLVQAAHEEFGDEPPCSRCGGEGLCWDGADPLDDCPYDPHPCHACKGSGHGKDQVHF